MTIQNEFLRLIELIRTGDLNAAREYILLLDTEQALCDGIRLIAHAYRATAKSLEWFHLATDIAQKHSRSIPVLVSLAKAFGDYREFSLAFEFYQRILQLDPDSVAAHSGLGACLKGLGKPLDGARHLRHALSLDPASVSALINLSSVLKDIAEHDEALELLQRAVQLEPSNIAAKSNLIALINYDPAITPGTIKEVARALSEQLDAVTSNDVHVKKSRKTYNIGFCSGDFGEHPVGIFLLGLLRHLNQKRFKTYLFSSAPRSDSINTELRSLANSYVDISMLSDDQAVDLIRGTGLDVLIDLSGHTSGSRLGIFRRRCARIQAAWLGYCGTTGVAEIDYILCDKYVLPESHYAYFTESPLPIQGCYLAYDASLLTPYLGEQRSFATGRVNFGSFNNSNKINRRVISLWSRILQRVPNSTLVLKAPIFGDPAAQEKMVGLFANENIQTEKLKFYPHMDKMAHFNLLQGIDVALDPLPYNGVTSTFENILCGTPTVSMAGDRFISRNGLSILSTAGLESLVASNEDEYVELATTLGLDSALRARAKEICQHARQTSSLFDCSDFARRFETALLSVI
jgi:protein O-GlcNAc transferase